MPSLLAGRRSVAIAGGVVLFHVAALWGMQSGLIRRAVEVVVPVEVLAQLIEPPKPPAPEPPKPEPPKPPEPKVARPAPKLPPPPMPVAIPDPTPAPNAPLGSVAPQPPAPPVMAPVAPAPAPSPPAPPARVQLPMLDADYGDANEEAFRPPPISRRLGETGTVLLRITVGVDGTVTNASLVQSSGFQRLDEAALKGSRKLKFRPATRGGVPLEWTYELPVRYT
jgi:protein TonB